MHEVIIKKDFSKIRNGIISTWLMTGVFFTLAYLSYSRFSGTLRIILVTLFLIAATVSLIVAVVDVLIYPKSKNMDLPIASLLPTQLTLNYLINKSADEKTSNYISIPWSEILEIGLFHNGKQAYVTITLVDPEQTISNFSLRNKTIAKYYTRLCGTPVAFLVSNAEKTPEEIKKEIIFYHSAAITALK